MSSPHPPPLSALENMPCSTTVCFNRPPALRRTRLNRSPPALKNRFVKQRTQRFEFCSHCSVTQSPAELLQSSSVIDSRLTIDFLSIRVSLVARTKSVTDCSWNPVQYSILLPVWSWRADILSIDPERPKAEKLPALQRLYWKVSQ